MTCIIAPLCGAQIFNWWCIKIRIRTQLRIFGASLLLKNLTGILLNQTTIVDTSQSPRKKKREMLNEWHYIVLRKSRSCHHVSIRVLVSATRPRLIIVEALIPTTYINTRRDFRERYSLRKSLRSYVINEVTLFKRAIFQKVSFFGTSLITNDESIANPMYIFYQLDFLTRYSLKSIVHSSLASYLVICSGWFSSKCFIFVGEPDRVFLTWNTGSHSGVHPSRQYKHKTLGGFKFGQSARLFCHYLS